jgi:hypothetical protein
MSYRAPAASTGFLRMMPNFMYPLHEAAPGALLQVLRAIKVQESCME